MPGISTDSLFAEPFEPLWHRRQREARKRAIVVRYVGNKQKVGVRGKQRKRWAERSLRPAEHLIDHRVYWRPKPTIPITVEPIPCRK